MLDRLIGEQTVGTQEIRSIAETLADFHRGASRLNAFRYGSASAVSRMVMENIAECERFEGDMVSPAQVAGLATYNRVFVADHWELLNRRARDGLVCEGHGDIRCEQICLPDQDVVIFDCLEFSEALRYCDVACDLGFLVMDLERLGAAQLSSEVAGYYVQLSGDTDFMSLLDFYKCYRAVVRAKVECLRSRDTDASEDERQKARTLARRYFSMACRYARCHDGRQAIIVVFGPAGSGKSTVAHALEQRLCYDVVGSDETRKRMAGASPTASRKADYGEGIYTEEFTRRTYNQLIVAAEQRLSEDQGVILDATFRHPEQRRRVREIAKSAGAPCLFVECRVAEKELLRRLRKRSQLSGVISDADVGIYSRQRTDFVQADEIPTENRLEADTTQGSESAIAAVEKWLARNCS